jgi:hypothetical protein
MQWRKARLPTSVRGDDPTAPAWVGLKGIGRRPAHRQSSHTFWPRGHASRQDSRPSTPGIDGVSARPLTPEPEIDGQESGVSLHRRS